MAGVSLGERSGPFLSNLPFYSAAGLGLVPGCSRVVMLGHNPIVDIATDPEDVWEGGGLYPFQATASTLSVVSTSANDTAAGTGARTILISGLNSAYAPITEVVTLNGLTPVITTNSFLRINLCTTTSSGSGEVNAGDISVNVSGGGALQALLRAGYGFNRSAVYTVPAGNTLFITNSTFAVNTSPGAVPNGCTFGIFQRSSTGNRRITLEFQVTSTAPYQHNSDEGIVFSEKTDITLRAQVVAQNSTDITAASVGFLFTNTSLLGL